MARTLHFGVYLRESIYGLKLTRENYAIINKKSSLIDYDQSVFFDRYSDERKAAFLKTYEDKTGLTYSDEFCEEHKKKALYNYDLNMKFYEALDHDEFNRNIENFLRKNRNFKEIFDLNDVDKVSGYYVMILDEYRQMYIGTSINIRRRIMSHWSGRKAFDRLIFGSINSSLLSIESFRALDTTRILVYPTYKIYETEDKYINSIQSKFCTNRTSGGQHDSLLESFANGKNRKLTD